MIKTWWYCCSSKNLIKNASCALILEMRLFNCSCIIYVCMDTLNIKKKWYENIEMKKKKKKKKKSETKKNIWKTYSIYTYISNLLAFKLLLQFFLLFCKHAFNRLVFVYILLKKPDQKKRRTKKKKKQIIQRCIQKAKKYNK